MRMTKREKIVAIAKDVLAQLRKRNHPIIPANGDFILPKNGYRFTLDNCYYDSQLQEHVDTIQNQDCQVCALGATLLSKARLFDNAKISSIGSVHHNSIWLRNNRPAITESLEDIFSKSQLHLIESAFEKFNIDGKPLTPSVRNAIAFGEKYEDPKKRMRAIMDNIIKNNGKFVPPTSTYKEGN